MGSTKTGGAVHNGAGFDDVQKLIADSVKEMRGQVQAHNDKMEEYHKGTIEVVKTSNAGVLSAIADSHKKTSEIIKVDGEETRKLVADTHAKAMEVVTAGHKAVIEKIDDMDRRNGVYVSDFVWAIILGVPGAFVFWKLAEMNAQPYWNKFGFGAMGFILVGMLTIFMIWAVRGLCKKRSDAIQETESKVKPEVKSDAETPKSAKKAEPVADPEPEATEVDDTKSSGAK